jgi:hypothetical protein
MIIGDMPRESKAYLQIHWYRSSLITTHPGGECYLWDLKTPSNPPLMLKLSYLGSVPTAIHMDDSFILGIL